MAGDNATDRLDVLVVRCAPDGHGPSMRALLGRYRGFVRLKASLHFLAGVDAHQEAERVVGGTMGKLRERVIGGIVEEIAGRVTELLAERAAQRWQLLDTRSVARMLGASEEWVREHAAELGAVRLGDGPKGALRFDPARVRGALERRRLRRPQEKTHRRRGPRRHSLEVVPAEVPADVSEW